MTEVSPGYRLRVLENSIQLLDEDGNKSMQVDSLPSTTETPLYVRRFLQPNGWLVEVNGKSIANVSASNYLRPEIRLFVESGQAFFTDISASGLEPPSDNDQ
jgi:hypothetical protein